MLGNTTFTSVRSISIIYQDNGYSGVRLDRPALYHLRDAVAQGEVETVLILSPDRLARQFAYRYIVVEEFERTSCEQTPTQLFVLAEENSACQCQNLPEPDGVG